MKSVRRTSTVFLVALALVGCNANEKGSGGSNTSSSGGALAPTGQSTSANNSSTANNGGPTTPTNSARPNPTGDGTSGSDVLATIDNIPITRAAVEKPLIEAYGLNMLAKVAQLELVKREAAKRGVAVEQADIDAETERYLNSLFNEDKDPTLRRMNEELQNALTANNAAAADKARAELTTERFRLLDQLLQQQKVSRADFNLVMQTNTYLRRIALSVVKKDAITEENLRDAFNQLYGEKVEVRDIVVGNLQDATEAKRRVASGEAFEKVAREMSKNGVSAPMGGLLAPFSRDNPQIPQQFKDVAFALRPGEVSDPVSAANGYHIIKLEQRIPPKLVKFDDYREIVRKELYERQIEFFTREMSNNLKLQSADALKIFEPVMKKQFDEQVLKKDEQVETTNDVRKRFERQRQELFDRAAAASQPSATTQPAGGASAPAPTTRPTTQPAK